MNRTLLACLIVAALAYGQQPGPRAPQSPPQGPTPYGQLDALVSWIEEGKAPQTLTAARRDQAGAITRSRPLCPYPLVAKYKGTGSTDDAANFVCSTGFSVLPDAMQ
jgi:Tannase and feruloyl esterase